MLFLVANVHHVVVDVHHVIPIANVHCVVASCWCSSCCWLLVFIALWLLLILLIDKQMKYIVHVHHVLKSVHCFIVKVRHHVVNWKCSLCCWKVIALCYNKWINYKVTNHVALPLTWHISQIIVNIWSLIFTPCI
jgi:hypothetical protein